MMGRMFYGMRGRDQWPRTTATVSSTELVGTGGRSGRTMNIVFIYRTGSTLESGTLLVDDNSSLYGLADGEEFSIQFNPRKPSTYYCAEAKSLSESIRRTIGFVGAGLVIVVMLIELLGLFKK